MVRSQFRRPIKLSRVARRFGVALAAVSASTGLTIVISNQMDSLLAGLIGTSLAYLIATSIYATVMPRSAHRS